MFERFRSKRKDPTPSAEDLTPSGVNPDRVRVEEGSLVEPEKWNKITHSTLVRKERILPRIELDTETRLGSWLRAAIAAAAIGTVVSNADIEHTKGTDFVSGDANRIEEKLETVEMGTAARQVREEVCRVVGADFMHRFVMKNADGKEVFNPGAVILPFAVDLAQDCKARVDVELHIPYHFARTFKEVVAKSPEQREALIQRLSDFISDEVRNLVVIRGIAGVTDTRMVYDSKSNSLLTTPRLDFGNMDISDIEITGLSSAEAESSVSNAGPDSLRGENVENVMLNEARAEDMIRPLKEALSLANVDPRVLESIKVTGYERNLISEEITELAVISKDVLGIDLKATDDEYAFELIKELNANNSEVRTKVNENAEYAGTVKRLIDDARGVEVSFTADTERQKNEVFNVLLPLPALLMLLAWVRLRSGGVDYKYVDKTEWVSTPAVHNMDVSRRLFSETTPTTLDKERNFNDLYESIDLSESAKDTAILTEHLMIEEVLPSLDSRTIEPMIDYLQIIEDTRQYLRSDTRVGDVKKGSYATTAEAQLKAAEAVLQMWEKHDTAIYPMKDIDIKNVLNYRHSPQIVYWAKTLAETLIEISKKTESPEEAERAIQSITEELVSKRMEAVGVLNRNRSFVSTSSK